MLHITEKRRLINFIKEVLREPLMDFSPYKDVGFCNKLKALALNDVSFILFKAQLDHSVAHKSRRRFDLAFALNTVDPQTKLTALDYCLAAGLDSLALRLYLLGARSQHTNFLNDNLTEYYSETELKPHIVEDIQYAIRKMDPDNEPMLTVQDQSSSFNWYTKNIKWLIKEHKFAAILFFMGLICCIASPFVPVAATILLLAVGIPAILASINSYQNDYNAINNRNQLENIEIFIHENQEIRDLIKECSDYSHNLRNRSVFVNSKPVAVSGSNLRISKFVDYTPEELLLHRYNSRELITEIDPEQGRYMRPDLT